MPKVRTYADLFAVARDAEIRNAGMRRERLKQNLEEITRISSTDPEAARGFIQGLTQIERNDLLEHAPDLFARGTSLHDLNTIAYGARALLASASPGSGDVRRLQVQRHLARVATARVSVPGPLRPDLTKRLREIDEAKSLGEALRLWVAYRVRAAIRAVLRASRGPTDPSGR